MSKYAQMCNSSHHLKDATEKLFFHTIYSVSKLIDVLYFVLIYTQKGLFQWPSSGGEMNCTSEHICSKNSYIIKETLVLRFLM